VFRFVCERGGRIPSDPGARHCSSTRPATHSLTQSHSHRHPNQLTHAHTSIPSIHTAMQWVAPVTAATAATAAPPASASPLKLLQRSEEEDKQAEHTTALRRHVAQVEQEVRRIFDGLGSPGQSERTGQGKGAVPLQLQLLRCAVPLSLRLNLIALDSLRMAVHMSLVSNEADRAVASQLRASLMFGESASHRCRSPSQPARPHGAVPRQRSARWLT
jgi:hypothetical protein